MMVQAHPRVHLQGWTVVGGHLKVDRPRSALGGPGSQLRHQTRSVASATVLVGNGDSSHAQPALAHRPACHGDHRSGSAVRCGGSERGEAQLGVLPGAYENLPGVGWQGSAAVVVGRQPSVVRLVVQLDHQCRPIRVKGTFCQ